MAEDNMLFCIAGSGRTAIPSNPTAENIGDV
jgi:hypothetical protein